MSRHGVQDLQGLVRQALMGAGASAEQAESTARALGSAQAQGLASLGLSRVSMYAGHIAAGRVDGQAVPRVLNGKGGAALIDAGDGFAFAACELARGSPSGGPGTAGLAGCNDRPTPDGEF